ncbi:MAG: hypothetical protein OZ948_17660 [Deltaproteobacteria bacterium]|nr:hypothetical protein [Deltaproteobacteria bacterium]
MRRLTPIAASSVLLALLAAGPAAAADPAPVAPAAGAGARSATEINKQLSNPVSDLWSITFQQNNFLLGYETPEHGDRWSSNLLFQPVLPVSISEDWNLITRPVIPLFASQPHPDEEDPFHANRSTAFGDTAFLQLASPTSKLVGKWLLGVGPTWVFPTAGSDYTGSGRWQVGPAAVAGYLSEKWIAGALFQNWWSFAGSNGRDDAHSMNLQPFFAYFLPDGWSVGYSGNVLANWKANRLGDVWTVPLGLSVAKVVKLGRLPVRLGLAGQYMVVSPDEYGQRWNVQVTVAPVLPKLVHGQLSEPSSLRFGLEPGG